MLQIQRWVRNFFGFSRSQTNAFLILLPLMGALIFSEPLYRWWISEQTDDLSTDQAALDSLIVQWEQKTKDTTGSRVPDKGIRQDLFAFDPNTATPEIFRALGFPENLSTRIAHYREKGGKFRVKGDLRKIYGMDSSFYQQLYPFIELPEKIVREKRLEERPEKRPAQADARAARKFDINLADTAQLKEVYGIGEKLSLRIIRYREGLGGFISTRQLSEVYGLDSAVVSRLIKVSFIAESFRPRQINVNVAGEKELSVHPYLSKPAARAIVAYRFQHGDFRSLNELEKIQSVGAKTFQKIAPYLKLE